jgi:hypothetical protein
MNASASLKLLMGTALALGLAACAAAVTARTA